MQILFLNPYAALPGPIGAVKEGVLQKYLTARLCLAFFDSISKWRVLSGSFARERFMHRDCRDE
jgi:hypothetical protein